MTAVALCTFLLMPAASGAEFSCGRAVKVPGKAQMLAWGDFTLSTLLACDFQLLLNGSLAIRGQSGSGAGFSGANFRSTKPTGMYLEARGILRVDDDSDWELHLSDLIFKDVSLKWAWSGWSVKGAGIYSGGPLVHILRCTFANLHAEWYDFRNTANAFPGFPMGSGAAIYTRDVTRLIVSESTYYDN